MKSICYDRKYRAPCNCEKVIRCLFSPSHSMFPFISYAMPSMGCIKLHNYTWPVKIYILARESNARQSDDNMESICSLDDDKS